MHQDGIKVGISSGASDSWSCPSSLSLSQQQKSRRMQKNQMRKLKGCVAASTGASAPAGQPQDSAGARDRGKEKQRLTGPAGSGCEG